MKPGAIRDRLTAGIYLPKSDLDANNEPLADLELALQCAIDSETAEAKMREGVKSKHITASGEGKIAQALQLNFITDAEADLLYRLRELRSKVIKVDDFAADFDTKTEEKLS